MTRVERSTAQCQSNESDAIWSTWLVLTP